MKNLFLILIGFLFLNSCSEHSNQATANKSINVSIEGMTCAEGCAKHIEETLAEVPGITQSKVNFNKKIALFTFDSLQVNTEQILVKIQSLNEGQYKAKLVGIELPATEKEPTTEEAIELPKKDEAQS